MPPFEQDLGNGFILRTVRDERDIERYSAFHFHLFHNAECVTIDRLLRHHPEVSYDDFFLVEDTATGRIASTTCLVPWHCRYEEAELRLAQLEVVATHPDYRRRGLVRAQIAHFHHRASEQGYELCAIAGIPYYYRQFGYSYALDQGRGSVVPAFVIPSLPPGQEESFRLRRAVESDAGTLARLYDEAMHPIGFHDTRSLDFWRYLLRWAQHPATIVEEVATSLPAGYISAVPAGDGSAIMVSEAGVTRHDVAMAVLRLLKAQGAGQVIVTSPAQGTLARVAASLGAPIPRAYQWLLRLNGLARFLTAIGPVLERRLAASTFAGLTGAYCLNNYHEAVNLAFENGRLAGVTPLGFREASNDSDGGDFQLPPSALLRLMLGYRTCEQLRDAWPDIVIRPGLEPLLEALFPPMSSHLILPYSYSGPIPETPEAALSAGGRAGLSAGAGGTE